MTHDQSIDTENWVTKFKKSYMEVIANSPNSVVSNRSILDEPLPEPPPLPSGSTFGKAIFDKIFSS